MATQAEILIWKRSQDRIKDLVEDELATIWAKIQHLPADTIRDTLLEVIPDVIDKYGSVAASAAAEWYELLLDLDAEIPDLYQPEVWRSNTRWALSPLYDGSGDGAAAFAHLVSTAQRQVLGHARQTIDHSVARHDNVFYARVPTKPDPCHFCIVMASRGPVYGTKESATRRERDGGKYHTECGCIAVPMRGQWVVDTTTERGMRWEGDQVAGYDFEKLYAEEYAPYHGPGDSVEDVVRNRREALADAEKVEKVAQRTATRASRSKQDPPAIVDGQPPKDWNKGRRVVHGYGGTKDLPGRFVNPSSETLWPHELPSVNRLLAKGKDVEWLPEAGQGPNPDLRMDGRVWDLKSPTGSSEKNTISDQFKSASKQADAMVIDLARIGLPETTAVEQIRRRFFGASRLKQVLVIQKDGTLISFDKT